MNPSAPAPLSNYRGILIKTGIALLSVLGVLVLLAVFLDTSERRAPAAEALFPSGGGSARTNMALVIPVIFDSTTSRAWYDWTIVDDAQETLVEMVVFELGTYSYEVLLASTKQNPTDEDFTIAEYLSITLTVPTDNGVDTILYIDRGANATLDSVFLNDEPVVNPQVFMEAETKYARELRTIERHMRGM